MGEPELARFLREHELGSHVFSQIRRNMLTMRREIAAIDNVLLVHGLCAMSWR